MGEITLREHQRSGPYVLSVSQRDALRDALPTLAIEPAAGTRDAYHLTPGSTAGAVEVDGLPVLLNPKIGIPQLLSLACYAIGRVKFQERDFDFPEDSALPDVLALLLAAQARKAFAQGLLHGYRTREEALQTVRGRVMFDEQLRRRFGALIPVESRYDEFTEDILPNRLVKAAALRLRGMRLRSPKARAGLGWTAAVLDNVSVVEFAPKAVPEVAFDRLNERCRGVVTLARLILRHGALQGGRGGVPASGFLVDMSALFQEFVTQALREALGVSPATLRSDANLNRILTLDTGGRVSLQPDLSWWDGAVCRFVGDVKYKRIRHEGAPNADLYQLLAYATALDLPGGLLIYAEGEAKAAEHRVRGSGLLLRVAALDISGSLESVLRRVEALAGVIAALRAAAR